MNQLIIADQTPDQIRSLILDPQSIDENLNCGICQELPIQPKECEECQHLFCLSCITSWTAKNRQCPFKCSQKDIKLKEPHRFVKSAISSIKVKCVNQECELQLEFGQLESHIKNCDHASAKCINVGCEEIIKNKNKVEHQKICLHRLITCEQCQEQYKVQMKHDCVKYLKSLIDQQSALIKMFQQFQIDSQQKLSEQQQQIKGLQEQINQVLQITKKCKNGHILNWSQPRYNVVCNMCFSTREIIRHECLQCKYFVCQSCLKPSFKNSKCPSQHQLVLSQKPGQGISCDFCGKNPYQEGLSVWSDRECDFDICQPCFIKFQA